VVLEFVAFELLLREAHQEPDRDEHVAVT
jgi:hypothetical protein